MDLIQNKQEDIDHFFNHFGEPEELHPDLKKYIFEKEGGWICLQHPLVYIVPYIEIHNRLLNKQYEQKKEALAISLVSRNYSQYVWLHERPHRVHAFYNICGLIKNDKMYWTLLGHIWTDSENIWQNMDLWTMLLSSDRKDKKHFMSKEDRKAFDELPKNLVLYRGHHGVNEFGYSFTLDKKKAEWFANRFGKGGKVRRQVIPKNKCIGYMNSRNEQEIVTLFFK